MTFLTGGKTGGNEPLKTMLKSHYVIVEWPISYSSTQQQS